MIILTDAEKNDLMLHYGAFQIDEQLEITSQWVSRKFPSTGRVARCIEENGGVTIKQVVDQRVYLESNNG